jgi:hypothetical protein
MGLACLAHQVNSNGGSANMGFRSSSQKSCALTRRIDSYQRVLTFINV